MCASIEAIIIAVCMEMITPLYAIAYIRHREQNGEFTLVEVWENSKIAWKRFSQTSTRVFLQLYGNTENVKSSS